MKKITLLLMIVVLTFALKAQITYTTVLTDYFEVADGFSTSFSVTGSGAWSATAGYTGTLWKDLFQNVQPTTSRTSSVQAYAEEHTGGTGTQCLKFNLTAAAFGTTPSTVRLRSLDNKISFNTAAFESISKYEVTFWARVAESDKAVILNAQNPNSYLTITTSWQKYTLTRYATGTSAIGLILDFYPLNPNVDFSIYIDEIVVKERKIAYTTAASAVVSNGFTANWAAVAGANAYSVIVEKSDGGTTPVWTAVAGSPFTAGNVTSYNVAALDAGATYRYRVTATDGSITTVESNNTFATTSVVSGIETIRNINNIRVDNGNLKLMVDAGKIIDVFNAIGVKQHSIVSNGNETVIQLTNKGIFIVKVGSESRKITF